MRIVGEKVTLRPFTPAEIEAALRHRIDRGESLSAERTEQIRARLTRSGRLEDGWLEFVIDVDGRMAGDVQARGSSAQIGIPDGVFEIGVGIFDERDRGAGLGSEAVALITGRLFEHEGAGRVQASTAVDNEAMRRSLEKLGFRFEGVLRGFFPADRAGDPRVDYAMYALTDADWRA